MRDRGENLTMLHWMRRHLGIAFIVVGLWMFPIALAIIEIAEDIMERQYTGFGPSRWDRFLAFINANVPHRCMPLAAGVCIIGGVVLTIVGIWKAAAPSQTQLSTDA